MKVTIRGITGTIASMTAWYELSDAWECGEVPQRVIGYKEVEILESCGKIVKLFGVHSDEISVVS